MLSSDAYTRILDMLMEGVLRPGAWINRRQIAAQLGTSVAPVLQAMIQLENEGYLQSVPRRGTQVSPIREADVVGNLLLKTGIECTAVRMVCGERIRQAYAPLAALAGQAEEAFCRYGHAPDTWRADAAFHTALVDLCGNALLSREYRRIALPNLYYQLNRCLVTDPTDRQDHRTLLERLVRATPERAEQAVRSHLLSGKPALQHMLASEPIPSVDQIANAATCTHGNPPPSTS